MTATLPPMIRFQPLVAGAPLPGGKVYFYAAGTLTPQAVYAADGTTPLANPLTLDANGATDFRLGTSLTYKINLTNSVGDAVAGWPVDQIIGTDGNLISLANTTNAALGDALVGVKPSGTTTGITQHSLNETTITPEMFGAVAGVGVSNAVRLANTVAINAAWAYLYGNGTLLINDTYETNGPIILGSNTVQQQFPSAIRGNGGKRSAIVGFGTGAVLDGTGARFVNMSNLYVSSTTAESGILIARTAVSGDCQSWILDNVTIRGAFSKASLITIAAEDLRAKNCQFWNSTVGAYTYMSSPNNTIIAATATYPILNSTNTDIRFNGCIFYSNTAGGSSNGLGIDTSFAGSFTDCIFLGDTTTTPNVTYGARINPGAGNAFSGKLLFDKCHWELQTSTGTSYMIYFDNVAASSYFGVDLKNNFNAMVGGGAGFLAWRTLTTAQMYSCTFESNLSPYGTSPILPLPFMNNCVIQAESNLIQIYGDASTCSITGLSIVFQAGIRALNCLVRERTISTDRYGVSPTPIWPTSVPSSYTGSLAERLVLGPIYYPHTVPIRGELGAFDSNYSYFPAVTSASGDVLGMFNGKRTIPIGVYEGAPATSAASGTQGQMLYDATNVYLCVASGTSAAAIVGGTGTVVSGSQTITLNAAAQAALASAPFAFINVVGLVGPLQVIYTGGATATLASPAQASVTGAALTFSTPIWKKLVLTAY